MRQIIQFAFFLFFTLIISSCEEDVKKKEAIRPVRYEVVSKVNGQKSRTFSGVASAGNEIELSFRSSGTISTLNAKVGQRVKKGDLLLKLDNVQAQLAFEQSVSALKSARSSMNTAKSSLERSKALYEKGSYSLSDYETAKNSFQSALDQYESTKRKLEIDKSQINYGYIYAPKAGVIAAVNSSLNETVSSGQTMAILNAGDEINVLVGMPESVINNIVIGASTDINFTSLENGKYLGSIIEIAPIVDLKTSTFPVKVDISNPSSSIKPGMVANVTFIFGTADTERSNALVIPVKSVGEDGDGNFVFIIESDDDKLGIVNKQTILLGELTNSGFVVKEGLKEGQKIATAGLQSLLDGQKVILQ